MPAHQLSQFVVRQVLLCGVLVEALRRNQLTFVPTFVYVLPLRVPLRPQGLAKRAQNPFPHRSRGCAFSSQLTRSRARCQRLEVPAKL